MAESKAQIDSERVDKSGIDSLSLGVDRESDDERRVESTDRGSDEVGFR